MQITTVMVVMLIVWCLVTILKNGYQPVPLPLPGQPAFQPGGAGLAEGHGGALHHRHRHPDRPRPLAAGHERRREPGAGEPRNRPPQAEEPGARRLRDLHLQHAVHVAGLLLRRDDHSRCRAARVPRQPDRRPVHVPRRPAPAAPAVPRLRRAGGHADPRRRREHRDHRLQRRAQPRGRRRRAARLVPPSAQDLRHHLAPHQPDRRSCSCSPSSSAAATCRCWAKPTRSAWSGASP